LQRLRLKYDTQPSSFAYKFNVCPCNEGAGDRIDPSHGVSFGDAVLHTARPDPRRALLQSNSTAATVVVEEKAGGFDLGTAGSAAGGAGAVSAVGTHG
jgi:hypothetical protein